MDEPRVISVLVADDHPLIVAGLAAIIGAEAGLALAGTAADGRQAVDAYLRLRPDVLLIDLNMPGGGGIEAIRRVRSADPDARIVILTSWEGDEDVHRGLLAGASAYLLKQAGMDQVLHCLRQVAANRAATWPGPGREAGGAGSRQPPDAARAGNPGAPERRLEQQADRARREHRRRHREIPREQHPVQARRGFAHRAACVAMRRGLIHPA
jgi:DNA-binding NarL/FixJ family response regulator